MGHEPLQFRLPVEHESERASLPGKVPAGVVTNDMFAAVDWLPTLAGMVGASNLVPKDRPIDASALMTDRNLYR
jgi:hypothetical protein